MAAFSGSSDKKQPSKNGTQGSSAHRDLAHRERRTLSAPGVRGEALSGGGALGDAAAHCAAFDGRSTDLEKVLLAGGDPDGSSLLAFYSPPLHLAAARGHVGCLRVLLRRGARHTTDVSQRGGREATHVAALFDQLGALEVLLEAGAAVDAADEHGVTPLGVAAGCGHLAIVDLLLRKGAANDGAPLHAASRAGHTAVVKRLAEEATADCSPQELDQVIAKLTRPSERGSLYTTPSNVARSHGKTDAAAALEGIVVDSIARIYPKAPDVFDDNGDRVPPPVFCTLCDIVAKDLRGARANTTHATAQHHAWLAVHREARRKRNVAKQQTEVQQQPGEVKWRR